MQFASDAVAVGIGFGGSKPLTQLHNLFFPGAAAANFGPAAWCGHELLLMNSYDKSLLVDDPF